MVAHSVSAMAARAGAAEEVLGANPGKAREPLRSVQDTGRQALVELRRLLGVLRTDAIELEGLDDPHGPLGPGNGGTGTGQALIGMRERASPYGGALEARPRAEGGFAVRARLPVRSAG